MARNGYLQIFLMQQRFRILLSRLGNHTTLLQLSRTARAYDRAIHIYGRSTQQCAHIRTPFRRPVMAICWTPMQLVVYIKRPQCPRLHVGSNAMGAWPQISGP
jgi:hypothetical protein